VNFVQTSAGNCDTIITVKTPNTLYSFATPHKKQEIPSPKKDSTPPAVFFAALFWKMVVLSGQWVYHK
jgi:hypothetical protein